MLYNMSTTFDTKIPNLITLKPSTFAQNVRLENDKPSFCVSLVEARVV